MNYITNNLEKTLDIIDTYEKSCFSDKDQIEVPLKEIERAVDLYIKENFEKLSAESRRSISSSLHLIKNKVLKKESMTEEDRLRIHFIDQQIILVENWEHYKRCDSVTEPRIMTSTEIIQESLSSESRPLESPFDSMKGFFAFITQKKEEYPEYSAQFDTLIGCEYLESTFCSSKFAANIFGEALFSKKKIARTLSNIEGANDVEAVLTFLRGLTNYYNSIEKTLSKEEKEKFKDIFHSYYSFLLSALICISQKLNPEENWVKLGSELLQKDILEIENGKKSQGYWIPNISDHFVALKYGREKEKLSLSVFNLGAGVNLINKLPNGKYISETRLKKRPHVPLEELSKQIMKPQTEVDWTAFLDVAAQYLKNDPHSQRPLPAQCAQKMGDCPARSQWALLRSEFSRLFGKHPTINYTNFKQFFLEQTLFEMRVNKSEPVVSLGIDQTPVEDFEIGEALTEDQIYEICWRSYHNNKISKIPPAETLPKAEKWKGINIHFSTTEKDLNFKSLQCNLEGLFRSNSQLFIGRLPHYNKETDFQEIADDSGYYRIPNYFPKSGESRFLEIEPVSLRMNRNEEGEVTVAVEQSLTVEENGIKTEYKPKDLFLLKPGMTIQIKDFQISISEAIKPTQKKLVEKERTPLLTPLKEEELRRSSILKAVRKNGELLKHVSRKFRQDKEIVLAAVQQNPILLQFASESLKNDKEIVLAALKKDKWSFQYAGSLIQNDKQFVLELIKSNPFAFYFVGNKLKDDKEVVLETVRQSGFILSACENFINDKEVVEAAVNNSPDAISFVGEELLKDVEFMARLERGISE